MRWNFIRAVRTYNVSRSIRTNAMRSRAALLMPTDASAAPQFSIEAQETPIFRLVNFLSHRPHLVPTPEAMSGFGVQADEYQRWAHILAADSLRSAWSYITDDCGLVSMPSWLILSLLIKKVATSDDVPLAVYLALHYQKDAPPALRPTVITLTVSRLVAHNAYDRLRNLMIAFVQLPVLESRHVARLFRALAKDRRASTSLVISTLNALAARDLALLKPSVLNTLFAPSYMTADLASAFLRLVAKHGMSLSAAHWRVLIRVFSFRGWRKRLRYSLKRFRSQRPVHEAMSMLPYAKYVNYRRELAESPTERGSIHFASTIEFTKAYRSISRVLTHMKRGFPEDVRDWQHLFQLLLVQPKVHPRTLFRALKLARTDQRCLSDLDIHVMAVDGFIHRKSYKRALVVWNTIVDQKLGLTPWSLTAGIKTLTYVGHAGKAFELLLDFSPRGSDKKRPIVDTQTVNTFMTALHRLRRYDIVFQIWVHFEELFGLIPTHHTFCIFMKSAIIGSDIDFSFRGVLTSFGFGALVRRVPREDNSPDAAARRVRMALASAPRASTAGTLDGEPAGDVALRIADRFFLTHFPELRDIKQPVYALRPHAAYPFERPVADLTHSLFGDLLAPSRPWNHPPVLPAEDSVPDPQLREIIPTNVVFRTYIDLLAAMNKVPRIPLALAWARTLKVPVSRTTLATALVYWHEICSDAPLVEFYKTGKGSQQYQELVTWMEGWVGKEAMPTEEDVQEQFRRVYALRRIRM